VDANGVDALIEEADRRLMMGAKKNGKNSVYIVGGMSFALRKAPRSHSAHTYSDRRRSLAQRPD